MKNIRKFTQGALFCIIVVLLAFTPIGYINLGFIKVTTIHIPVIIASILLGPSTGALVGITFGLTSFLNNSFISPSVTSFLFTPLYENSFGKGNFLSLIICFLPRILTGVIPYYFCKLMEKFKVKSKTLLFSVASVAGSLTNTLLVMSMAYFFFGQNYASALDVTIIELPTIILSVIFTNGLAELIAAAIIGSIICSSLKRIII